MLGNLVMTDVYFSSQMSLKESPFVNHFMHLWNLLCRSNFYASTLLAVIEEEHKKKKKSKTKNLKLQV